MTNRRRPVVSLDGDPVEPYVFRSHVRVGVYGVLIGVTLAMVCLPAAWAWWFSWMVALIATVTWGEIDHQRYIKRRP